jgi:hypothetical protein
MHGLGTQMKKSDVTKINDVMVGLSVSERRTRIDRPI